MKKIYMIAIAGIMAVGVAFMSSNAVASSNKSVDNKTFVKTKNRCQKCSCSGYWGYKHLNGTYEGSCSNSDGHGHTCGHSPEKHGLRSW